METMVAPPSHVVRSAGTETGQIAQSFVKHPLFGPPNAFLAEDNPFRRSLRPQDVMAFDLTRPLSKAELVTGAALFGHRLLCTIYETDLFFLPESLDARHRDDFNAFYADDLKVLGERLRRTLERQLFAFLDGEIDVSGPWTMESFRELPRLCPGGHASGQ